MLIAAFVGTTMAAATFLSRRLFIQRKGWSKADWRTQRNNFIIAGVLIFSISGAIMAVMSGSLYGTGSGISRVVVMCFVVLFT